jgi:protein-L-isoaspartate(D-aspartate) O-methyltransferase
MVKRHDATSRALSAIAVVILCSVPGGCDSHGGQDPGRGDPDWTMQRERMVSLQIEARGVKDPLVLESMRSVPRHLFVPENSRDAAYNDSPVPIGDSQTISQPYIVALMTELLEVKPGQRVLEIGTGSGYQAAVLAAMGIEVRSIEIRPRLCEHAARTLSELDYDSVQVRCGDGYGGWPEDSPFDGIIVTAAPDRVPEPLLEQLGEGAKMVIPVGDFYQELKVITRTPDGFEERSVIPVRFVPMTGEVERQGGS